MSVVVDASVALKWVLDEPESTRARSLVGSERLVAPDFFRIECAHVLAKYARRGLLTSEYASAGLQKIEAVRVSLAASGPLVSEAQRLALAMRTSVYDSLYLAVALSEGASLVTADVRFADAVGAAYPGVVRLL